MFNQVIFNDAFARVIGHEGGYVNDLSDPGGETNFGISKRSYPDVDILNLTLPDAKDIYKKDYWLPLKCDQISSDEVAIEIFDTGVNMGRSVSIICAQEAANFLNPKDALTVDGKIGPLTLREINIWCLKDVETFFKVQNGFQFMHYVAISEGREEKDPETAHRFNRGWMKRIQNFRGE